MGRDIVAAGTLPADARESGLAALVVQLRDIERQLLASTSDAAPAHARHATSLIQEQDARAGRTLRDGPPLDTQAAVLNALPAHVALIDTAGVIISVNDAWMRFATTGGLRLPDGGVGTNYATLCDRVTGHCEADARQAARGLRAVLAGDDASFSMEYPCPSPSEHVSIAGGALEATWYRMTVTPMRSMGPDARSARIDGAVVMHVDVTERRLSQHATLELSERLDAMIASVTDGFLTLDRQWRFTYLNPEAERLLLQPRKNLLGQGIWGFFPEAGATPFGHALRRASADYTMVTLTVLHAPLNRWFEVRIYPSSAGLAIYLRDVDDQHKMAVALDQERARLVAAQAVAKIGSWDMDLITGECEWSDETYRIFETDRSRFAATRDAFHSLVHPDDRAAVDTGFLNSLAAGIGATQLMEHRILLPGGIQKTVEERWTLMRDASGAAVRALGTCQDVSERKRAQQELSQSHAQMSMVCRLARVGAWSLDMARPGVDWSDEVCALHDVEAGTVPSLDAAIGFYAPEHVDTIRAAALGCLVEGIPFDLELEIVTALDRRVWVRAIGEPVRDQAGTVLSIRGALQDLSERKQSEQETRKLTQRLTNTLESITIGFYTLDSDWRFTYINVEAERMLERNRADLLGQVLWQEFPAADNTELASGLRRALRDGCAVLLETTHVPCNTWCRVSIYPAEGGLAIYYRDISSERAARQQLELLEASVSRLNDMVVITEASPLHEPGPHIVFANDAFLRASGLGRDEVLGRSPRFMQGPLTDRGELDRIHKLLEVFEPVHSELVNYTSRGEPYWVEMDIVPISVRGEGFSHFVSVQRDITERRHDQDALRELNDQLDARVRARTEELVVARDVAEEASQAKSAFLAAMSHEIRTPMNGVLGMIEVLHQTSLKGYQVEMIDLIRDSAFSLLRIIEDILDLSKIEAGKLSVEVEPMNLAGTVEKVGGMFDHMAENKGVELSVFIDPRIPSTVMGDETRLRQVMVNLVGNAIKFSSGREEPGRIALRATLADRTADSVGIEIRVSDNGIGMDEGVQSRLFTPFSQADASTTRRFGGTGLGLAISNMLVELMAGTISVTSARNRGATFTVRLRLSVPTVQDASAEHAWNVAGLRCRIVGVEHPLAEDVTAYLLHGGAVVERSLSLTSACASVQDPGLRIWLLLPDVSVRTPTELSAMVQDPPGVETRFIALGRGWRRGPDLEATGFVSMDTNAFLRRTLLKAVALSAGRLTADVAHDDSDIEDAYRQAPLRHVARKEGRLVLVAEDNETNRKVIVHQLHLIGFAAEVVVNGKAALEKWRTGDFAIVITDLHMPEMDGYTLAAAIRSEEVAGRRTPIIALTANVLRDEEARCRECGMDAYLSKPISIQRLRSEVESWLGAGLVVEAAAAKAVFEDSSQGVVDLRALVDLIGDDSQDLFNVLETFRRGAMEAGESLRQAVAEGMPSVAADTAHKLKSGARTIGAFRLGDICAEIETLGTAGRIHAVADTLPSYEAEMSAVLRFLDTHRRLDSSLPSEGVPPPSTMDTGVPGFRET